MGRVNQQFQTTKTAEIPRSSFDLSHGYKTTFNSSELVPILNLEVLPGDTISCRASLFGRMATPLKPVMDNLYLETFFFFTPMRQLWENWPKFMGEQINPGDSIDYAIPTMSNYTVAEGSLYDYFGIPLGTDFDLVPVSSLPFRNYYAVYNFWFRDENLIDSLPVTLGDGPDTNNYLIQKRRKRRDYITSALPWPQKGEPVTLPFSGNALVTADQTGTDTSVMIGAGTFKGNFRKLQVSTPGGIEQIKISDIAGQGNELYADLSSVAGATVADLREAFQIQKLLERDARGGTRYPEILQSHFRVTDPGLLVHQRPLFLGGGSSRININPVTQTSGSATDPGTGYTPNPQGNLAAFGTVSGSRHGFTASFTEHGYILGLVNVRADLTYQQGLERYWSRSTRYDFYWPVLSHLGEQDIKNKEVYVSNSAVIDDEPFGYIPRYDEYRFAQSRITGLFRSQAAASLDIWHLAQDFATLPTLSKEFIEDNVPMDRVLAVPSEPDFLLDVYFKIRAARPLPLYAVPGLIDHF